MTTDKSIDLKQSSNNINSINIYISIILQPVRKRKTWTSSWVNEKKSGFFNFPDWMKLWPSEVPNGKTSNFILKRERKYINVNKI